MICMALAADQMYNAARMQYYGYGRHLGRFNELQTDRLVDTIRQVAFDRSYRDNIRRAAAILRSRPMNARQTAAWWIEHVTQHGGRHLHSHGLDMVWYEYLMIDVIVLFVLLPVVVVTSGLTAVVCCLLQRCRMSGDANVSLDKKRK